MAVGVLPAENSQTVKARNRHTKKQMEANCNVTIVLRISTEVCYSLFVERPGTQNSQ
jgi:hypothetical protein